MTPRLRSDIVVAALLRRAYAAGDYGAVLRKGSAEAGAIFIRQRRRDGSERLFGPAPQSLVGDEGRARLFEARAAAGEDGIDAILAREIRFDPDCWIVEVEAERIETLIDLAGEGG
ncbi:DUF1491 family protein [Ensifer soli]|uniref:DUF1491 family protein n=1 Tax=Ciceribacter sp. sgz301302 TaxID=3342379 RepID=UPI0035B82DAF